MRKEGEDRLWREEAGAGAAGWSLRPAFHPGTYRNLSRRWGRGGGRLCLTGGETEAPGDETVQQASHGE